jgi:hypothetical protein
VEKLSEDRKEGRQQNSAEEFDASRSIKVKS